MIDFPKATMVRTNGIDMAVHEAGPKTGFPVVLCHGFPELAFSWRHQLPALAQAGYRAIAPDQRGYGGSSRPANVQDYDMPHLTGDLAGLLDTLEIEKAVFCGHDWGGSVVWAMPFYDPGRVAGIIGVNTPFFARPPMDPIALLRARFGDDMYMVFFQKPGEADAILAADVGKTFRFFMRRHVTTGEEYAKRPLEQRNLALLHALQSDEPEWRGEVLLDPGELQVFVDRFARTGFTGGINWYRNISRNWELSGHFEPCVPMPALMIMAEDDVVLTPAMADGMERFVPDLERVLIRNCGHWTQQEKPAETNLAMLRWLQRHFPA
ncbi:MAG: alpha/beta fold hydrolase [Rhizomicrobium sp.]